MFQCFSFSNSKQVASVALMLVSVLSYSSIAQAGGSLDIEATAIPATACQPAAPGVDDAQISLSNGAWVFTSGTGSINLYCAVPLSVISRTDDQESNYITDYSVYYRDSDGTGTKANVRALLFYRDVSGGITVNGSTFNSGIYSNKNNTRAHHNVSHTFISNRLYSFIVTMTRTSVNEAPAFAGIDFLPPPVL